MRALHYLPRLLTSGLGLTLLGCGAADLTLPRSGRAIQLVAFSGYDQEGTVGSRLPEPLVVKVRDLAGQPVADVPLVFRFRDEFPDAEIEPAARQTDVNGEASVSVRLGSTAGSQTVEATVAQDVASDARALFGVTALERRGGGRDGGGDDGDDDDDDDHDDDDDDDDNDDDDDKDKGKGKGKGKD
jgi:hypothetical protein